MCQYFGKNVWNHYAVVVKLYTGMADGYQMIMIKYQNE